MATKNDITGDSIQTKVLTEQGRDNWDNIFGKSWYHDCPNHGRVSFTKGNACDWCGLEETDFE